MVKKFSPDKNKINVLLPEGINIASQFLQTDADIGYVIIDTESHLNEVILQELKNIPHTIRAKMLN